MVAANPKCWVLWALLLWASLVGAVSSARAQLFTNLQALVSVLPASPPATSLEDGPKDIAAGDLDGDGLQDLAISNIDGTVTVYFGRGNGKFGSPIYLATGSRALRGIVCADLNQDGRADIVVAAPGQGQIHIFYSRPPQTFTPVSSLAAWPGARNMEAGDFNGDGRMDLVVGGPNTGIRLYVGEDGGTFSEGGVLEELNTPNEGLSEDFKPVYSLRAFRAPGESRDRLAATHAFTKVVWLCEVEANEPLRIYGALTNRTVAYGLDLAPVRQAAADGIPDLVSVHRDEGTVEVHASNGQGFARDPAQVLPVPGGPRAVRIVDLDGDGWNDLVVVVRNFDVVLTYHNQEGTLSLATERPVGRSPREVAIARFDADEHPDAAVMNRWSADVNVLSTFPGQAGFAGINQLYLADGEIAGLAVFDFNRDGRDDVIQLHRASGDFSVRLSEPGGLLGLPSFYTIGQLPAAQVIVDVNNDQIIDEVATHLGAGGLEQASVSIRLGAGSGGFGEEQRYYLPAEVEGRLFALAPADFDGNGTIDLAAGFLDARLALFEGLGNGAFRFRRVHPLTNELRALVAGDWDQDGDPDLAGVALSGRLVVIENTGNMFEETTLPQTSYSPPLSDQYGARTLKSVDLNEDNDLDLVVGSGKGAIVYRGGAQLSFASTEDYLPGTDFPVSSLITGDFDGQGREDIVVACRVLNCVSLLTQNADGSFAPALTFPTPSSSYLATGDLDGDGHPDLVGSGRVLWTALSGAAPDLTPPLRPVDTREKIPGPVINELLAINTKLPVAADGDRTVDWVELFNGGPGSVSLQGWRLRAVAQGGANETNEFVFPATAFFGKTNHLLVFFSLEKRTVYHTGFKLSGDGGILTLLDEAGLQVDQVRYPPQQADVSYSRFRDGLPVFVFNPFPSPRRSNPDNGRVEPVARLQGVNLDTLRPGTPIQFYASVRDDVGVASASILYQRVDQPGASFQRIELHDDGSHDDGAAADGRFGGVLEGGLPAGAEVQLYLEVVDLSEQVVRVPEEFEVALPGQVGTLPTLRVGGNAPALEISEVVSLNERSHVVLIHGEPQSPDWVEVRNISSAPISLDGVGLAHYLTDASAFLFPTGAVLLPSQHLLVLCDTDENLGPGYAPFRLSALGDQVVLFTTSTNRGRQAVDWAQFGALDQDQAWGRLGPRGPWHVMSPTPAGPNARVPWFCWMAQKDADNAWTLVFPTPPGREIRLESSASLVIPDWTSLGAWPGDGLERAIRVPLLPSGFFRFTLLEEAP